MNSGIRKGDKASAQCVLGARAQDGIKLGGKFTMETYRNGELIGLDESHNIVTNEGLTHNANVMFNGKTQTTVWYCGLVETNTTALATMTYAVPIFTESTAYTEAARPAYVEVTSTDGSLTNAASKAAFTINATKTMYGAGIFSLSTKGDTTTNANNILNCYSLFTSGRAVVADDVINLTYSLTTIDDA